MRFRAVFRPAVLRWTLFVAIAGGIGYGMARLERHVYAADRFDDPPKLVLLDVPEGLEPVLREHLEPVTRDAVWTEPDLCRRIHDRLESNAWVRAVDRVRRYADGTFRIRAKYRRPRALVQTDGWFALVDGYGVRLPGRYPYSEAVPLIQGVAAPAPKPGEAWNAPDLKDGLKIVDLLVEEPFADQVTAVLVHNHQGRVNPHAAHLELATDRAGGRILWGSAVGEEIEENSAAQKLAIIRRNYELHGRIDAGHAVIDVSTFPDRFTTPRSGS